VLDAAEKKAIAALRAVDEAARNAALTAWQYSAIIQARQVSTATTVQRAALDAAKAVAALGGAIADLRDPLPDAFRAPKPKVQPVEKSITVPAVTAPTASLQQFPNTLPNIATTTLMNTSSAGISHPTMSNSATNSFGSFMSPLAPLHLPGTFTTSTTPRLDLTQLGMLPPSFLDLPPPPHLAQGVMFSSVPAKPIAANITTTKTTTTTEKKVSCEQDTSSSLQEDIQMSNKHSFQPPPEDTTSTNSLVVPLYAQSDSSSFKLPPLVPQSRTMHHSNMTFLQPVDTTIPGTMKINTCKEVSPTLAEAEPPVELTLPPQQISDASNALPPVAIKQEAHSKRDDSLLKPSEKTTTRANIVVTGTPRIIDVPVGAPVKMEVDAECSQPLNMASSSRPLPDENERYKERSIPAPSPAISIGISSSLS